MIIMMKNNSNSNDANDNNNSNKPTRTIIVNSDGRVREPPTARLWRQKGGGNPVRHLTACWVAVSR